MTQKSQKIYLTALGLSLFAFSLTILEIQTIFLLLFISYVSYRYFQLLIHRLIKKGLINLLPQSMRNHLLNRSIFDFICDIWFQQSIGFIKLLFRPLFIKIEPENAIQALKDLNPKSKNKILTKGVINIMPTSIKTLVLGEEKVVEVSYLENQKKDEFLDKKTYFIKKQFDKTTNEESQNKFKMIRSNSTKEIHSKIIYQASQMHSQKELRQPYEVNVIHKWDKLDIYKKSKKPQTLSLIKNAQKYISMIKKIVEIKNVANQIQNISTSSILKLSIIFWIMLVFQIKVNHKTRKMIIKTLHIIISIFSVMGVIGTTGVLIYKHKTSVNHQNQEQKNQSVHSIQN